MITSFRGKRVGIVGAARSGLAAARLVARLNGGAFISEKREQTEFNTSSKELSETGIDSEFGGHDRLLSKQFDLVVLSPGVIPTKQMLDTWNQQNCEVISEIELAARCFDGDWIGVTGSNGKTTTCSLVHHIFAASGRKSQLVGNIGAPWCDALPSEADTLFVVEVSSFQLERAPTVHPKVVVILNIFENHLDRHDSLKAYAALKLKLAANQNSSDTFIFNSDDPILREISKDVAASKVRFGSGASSDWRVTEDQIEQGDKFILHEDIPLPGRHNMFNAAAAVAAAQAMEIGFETASKALRTAQPVEHRLEPVRRVSGANYINDSKSTNLTATIAALKSMTSPVVLLFGGRPKKESFSKLDDYLGRHVKWIVGFGEAREKLSAEIRRKDQLILVDDLSDALQQAYKLACDGESVLLSPGCASFDQYLNFEDRGKHFKELVDKL